MKRVLILSLSHCFYFNNNFQAQASEMQECDNRNREDFTDKALPTQIVISKLNPDVKEFFPKNLQSTNNVSSNHSLPCNMLEEFGNGKHTPKPLEEDPKACNNGALHLNSRKQALFQKLSETSHKACENGFGDCGQVIPKKAKETQFVTQDKTKTLDSDVQTYTKNEDKVKIIAILKEKISKIPKDSAFDKRKDRNAAIAALIKASTVPTPISNLSSSSSSPKPLLRAPSYFQRPYDSENLNLQDRESLAPYPGMSSPNLLEEDKCKDIENVEDIKLQENIKPKTDVTPVRTPVDPHMQESFDKVKTWLSGSPKPKQKPAELYQGPITFKKKKTIPTSNVPKTKSPVLTTPSYVPSKYAQELGKMYEERNQIKETQLDIWAKLERDLKIKDEEFFRRRREAQKNSNATGTTS